MATDLSKYVPLKRIVTYFLDEHNLDISNFDKAWIIAFRAFVDLGFDIGFEPASARLPVLGNKTCQLPPDYLSWTKIGIMDTNGTISTLRVNSAISVLKDLNPNRVDYLTPDINDQLPLLLGAPFFFNYYDNGVYNILFGYGGGLVQFGECRVDEKNNVIVLPPDFKYDTVLIEYLSSPQKNDDYQIQIVLQEAVIAFIAWKFKVGQRQDYYAAKTEGRRKLPNKKVTLQEVNQYIRSTDGMYLRG